VISSSIISKFFSFLQFTVLTRGRCKLALLSFLLSAGCASIDYADYRQTILVLSDPPGAKVYDGQRFIGITPNYMRFRRRAKPVLLMEMPDGTRRDVPLETRYRWGDSFGMNALFLVYAPVGWAVDWATGTAWEAEDPPLEVFGRGGVWPVITRPGRVAVAPPQGVDFETADALGLAVEEKMRASENFTVSDYEETAPGFRFYRSYSGLAQEKQDRYRLLSHLKVDHILISTAEKRGETFVVKGELKDVVTTKTKSSYTWEITPGNQALREEFTAKTLLNEYFKSLPNTVFLNFAGYTPTATIDRREYKGKEAPADGFGDEMLRYLSSLSLAGLERERFNTRGHFTFGFVPTAIVSQKMIVFPEYTPLVDAEFHRWYVSAGYGIEGGYMGRFGLLYADLIPMGTYTRIRYSTPQTEGAVERFSIQLMSEIGYSYFFTNHLIGRVYYRSIGEDNKLWNQAFSESSSSTLFTDTFSSGFAGVSIGYYIPTALKRRSGWLVKKK
jgi:hypothetical protein